MLPDSEEIRTSVAPRGRREAVCRAKVRHGGAMEDVAAGRGLVSGVRCGVKRG